MPAPTDPPPIFSQRPPPALASQIICGVRRIADLPPPPAADELFFGSQNASSSQIARAIADATQAAREVMFPNLFAASKLETQLAFVLKQLTSCPDVEAAISTMIEFCAAFWSPLGEITPNFSGDRIYITSATPCADQNKVFLHELRSCAITLSALDWLAGGTLRDLRAQSACRPNIRAEWLSYIFPYEITPGVDVTAYSLRAEDLKRPIVRAAAEVDAFLIRLPEIALWGSAERVAAKDLIRSIVEQEARKNHRIATVGLICARLGLSPATLRRRLALESVLYRELRDEVLNELAQEFLQEPSCTVAMASERLGFSEDVSFRRSFRRWNGCSPGTFRAKFISLSN